MRWVKLEVLAEVKTVVSDFVELEVPVLISFKGWLKMGSSNFGKSEVPDCFCF